MLQSLKLCIESYYLGYRQTRIDDKSWAHLHNELCQVFPECSFQFLINRELFVIKAISNGSITYFKCKYEDPTFIKEIGEEDLLRNAIQ